MPAYRTVFDLSESVPWGSFAPLLVILLMLVIGIGMLLVSLGLVPQSLKWTLGEVSGRGPVPTWFAAVWTSFVLFAFVIALKTVGSAFFLYRDALTSGRYQVVEGMVEDFDPMPYTGHKLESFTVEGIRFAYSDGVVTPAFHHTRSHGGPIRDGLAVRISYLPHGSGNAILKLDVDTDGGRTTSRPNAPSGFR